MTKSSTKDVKLKELKDKIFLFRKSIEKSRFQK